MGNDLLGADDSNLYGHYEDMDFIALNDRILKRAGGSWDEPPTQRNILNLGEGLVEELADFFHKKKHGKKLWGWKDPRTVLTIRLLLPYLDNPHFIAVHRHPNQIAESLLKRNGIPLKKGVVLAQYYHKHLMDFITDWYSGDAGKSI
jgi:hypothetical protein